MTVFCLPDSVALVIYPNWQEMQAQRNKPPANLPIAFGGTKFSPVERIPHEAQQYSSRLHRKTSVQLVDHTQTQQDISITHLHSIQHRNRHEKKHLGPSPRHLVVRRQNLNYAIPSLFYLQLNPYHHPHSHH